MRLVPARLQSLLRRPLSERLRWRLVQAALLVSGIALLVISSAFLLLGGWDERPRPSAAAGEAESVDEPSSAGLLAPPSRETLDVGPALAKLDANALFGGLVQFAFALRPTATPTPAPTPAPVVVVLEQPAPQPQAPAPASEPSSPPAPSAPDCPTASMSGFAQALFDAINSERVQAGLPALAVHGCVVYVGQLRSEDMASRNYFSHTSPEGTTAFSLLDQYGVPYGWAGENLARNNYPDDQSVGVAIRDLMASQGHRDNILSANYTHLGVGAAVDGVGMKYFTMVFIGPP